MRKARTIDGEALRAQRLAKGWSLTDVERHSGVSRVTVRRIEAGQDRPHCVTVRALEAALGATLAPQEGNHEAVVAR
jgi:transcriptional regulator with XRE-family HTH domain